MADQIAIVGVGCRFPGANNLREFWEILSKGENHVTEIPTERWNMDAFFDSNPEAIGKSYARKAGLLENVHHFDHQLFRINQSEAAQMDPHQRQVLECTYMALENAGITRQQIAGQKVGVYLGAMNSDYGEMISTKSNDISSNTVTGQADSIIANRVSFVFDLRGPSMVIDTACSSSIVAMHQAILGIKNGDCSMAISGAVNILMNPVMFVKLSKARMLSSTGQCHAFSANADGYTRGEGCGIVILKRLQQAEKDGDHIWATVVTGLNQDGRQATPITAPSDKQQESLLEEVYANIDPTLINYIEAHGTGTKLGDPTEVGALGSFFERYPRQRYLGSVKTNIGHLEAAAGVAGLIKVLLMMKHNTIVPSLHFDKPNELIDFDRFQFVVPTSIIPWQTDKKMACINSFGFGGSNSHVFVTDYPMADIKRYQDHVILPICFSGSNEDSLLKSVEEFANLADNCDLQRAAYTSSVKREHFPCRKAVLFSSHSELTTQLEDILENPKIRTESKQARLIFVFGGMGTAWQGMCVEFMSSFPVFNLEIENIDESLSRFVEWSLVERLKSGYDVGDPTFGPIAIFSCQVALARMLTLLDIRPAAVLGQSVGEVAAAHIAGLLPLGEAVKVIFYRTEILAKVTGGKMLLTRNIDADTAQTVCEKYGVDVALVNSPLSCTLSGDAHSIQLVQRDLETKPGIKAKELPVTSAFHSKHMVQCQNDLNKCLTDLTTEAMSTQMISTVDCSLNEEELRDPSYWGRNVRETVQLCDAVKKASDARSQNIYIEIGPSPVLAAHIDDILAGNSVSKICLPTMKTDKRRDEMMKSLAFAYECGIDVSWQHIFSKTLIPTDLPVHTFSRKPLLVVSHDKRDFINGMDARTGHLFLRHGNSDTQKKILIDPFSFQSVFEHNVRGAIILPGAVYPEAALGFVASTSVGNEDLGIVILDVYFLQLITLTPGEAAHLAIEEHVGDTTSINERKLSVVKDSTVCAKITVKSTTLDHFEDRIDLHSIKQRCRKTMMGDEIYRLLSGAGFKYGDTMSIMTSSQCGDLESLTTLTIGDKLKKEAHDTSIHPVIIDGMLQTLVTVAKVDKEVLPHKLENFILRRKPQNVMLVYTKLIHQSDVGDSFSLTLVTTEGLVICAIEKFVLKVIGKGDFDPCRVSYSIESQQLMDMFPRRLEPVGNNVVLFSDWEVAYVPWKEITLLQASKYSEEELLVQIQNATVVSVVLGTKPTETSEGESLQVELQRKIMFLIHLILTMSKNTSKIPLVVVAVLPTRYDTYHNEAFFCINEGISAFLRCARREYPHLHIQKFDISNLSEDSNNSLVEELEKIYQLDLTTLTKSTDVTLLNGEFMETRCKRLEKVTPNYRLMLSDENQTVALFVKGETVTDKEYFKVAVPERAKRVVNDDVSVNVETAVVHSKTLSDQIIHHGAENVVSNENPVLSYEFWGFSESMHSSEKRMVVAFYPSEVKSNILAPKECLLEHKYITGLNHGDMLKLYVIWCLCSKAGLTNVGILHSSKTKAYATVMAIMLTSRKITVSLLTPDDTRETSTIQSVISTIQITKTMSRMIDENWTSVKTFICLESITKTSNFQNLLMKKVQLLSIRAFEILSPVYIADHVPKLFKWIISNQEKLKEIKPYLTTYQRVDALVTFSPLDIADLLGTNKVDIRQDYQQTPVMVRISSNDLFLKTASYLVVGGRSGLGLECVSYLAKRGAGYIFILSRREPGKEIRKDMKSLGETYKCIISFLQADVTVYHSLKIALENIRQNKPSFPLRGVFFSAAVLKDGLISQGTDEWFEDASAPKVIGAWNVHILTKDDPLDYFVMFSSITSAVGNAGQANYGAGNGFLDGLAHIRRQKGLAGQTINWGPLDLGLLENRSDVRKKLEDQGFLVIEKIDIAKCLHHAIMLNETQIILCQLEPVALGQSLLKEGSHNILSKFESVLTPYMSKLTVTTTGPGIDMESLQGNKDQIMVQITEYIKHLVCDIAVLDTIDINSGSRDQGVDSMNFMQISGAIFRDTNVQISGADLTVQNPSVVQLAEMLYKGIFENAISKKESNTENQIPGSELELTPGEIFTFENYLRNPDHISLLMITSIDLPDAVSPDIMKVILTESVSRHPISHSTFHFENGKMFRRIGDPEQTFDFSVSSENDLEKKHHQRFFLDRHGPIRFICVLGKPLKLIIVFHSIAYDYQGILIIIKELLSLSYAYSQDKSMDTVEKLPDISIITEYKALLQSRYKAAGEFWKDNLTNVPYISFADIQIPQKSMDSFRVERELTKDEFEKLSEFSRHHNISFFHCLVGLFELLLSFRANIHDIAVTTYIDLRIFSPKIATSVGRCVNFAPLACSVPCDSTKIHSFLIQNSKMIDNCKTNGIFPFPDLRKALLPENAENMLTNCVIFGDDEVINERKGNAFYDDFIPEVTDLLLFGPHTELYFDIINNKKSGKVFISLNCREDCFSRSRTDELIAAYFGLLTDALCNPHMTLGDLRQQKYLIPLTTWQNTGL